MTTIDDNPLNHNKDCDNGDGEYWSDSRLEDEIFNKLMDSDNKYQNQAITKFRYLRLTLPTTFFDIDIEDFDEHITKQLETYIKDCTTKEEKYDKLNGIIAKVIFLIYKKAAEPQILSNTKEDKVVVKKSINEMQALVSNKWSLRRVNQTIPIPICLDELMGYVPPTPISQLSSLSEEKDEDFEEQQQQKDDNHTESNEKKNKHEDKEETEDKRNTISNILTSIKERYSKVFKDQVNRFYITLVINDHIECVALESSIFKNVIRNEYFHRESKILADEKLDGLIKLIESELMFNDNIKKIDLNLRVAKINDNKTIYYDLTNQKWETIKITSEGWNIVKNNQIPIFKRYENNCSSQVYPSKEYDKEIFTGKFLKLFNLESKNDILLLSVYIISLFIPQIPKVILVISGTGGGAKTTTFKIIKNVVDPGSADTFSFPKQINDLVQALAHHYVNFFDNVSSISEEVSDLLCRAVTGAGFNKRALYTDDTDIIYKFKRCIGINGINLATTRPDFLDRSLVIKLKRIDEKARKKEEDVDKEFEEIKPFVLGYIFDVLVKVLEYREDHKDEKILSGYPRMADFAEWGEIISRCIGYKDNEFINAYYENINNQNDEVIESSPVAEAVLLFVDKMEKEYWEGTPTELYKKLTDIIDQIKPELKRSNLWPKASNKLTSKINEIVSNLKEKHVEIITGEKNTEGNRVIMIRKLQKNTTNKSEIENDMNDSEQLFNPLIHRRGYSDTFECEKCPQKGDIHYMKQHIC